MGFSDFVGHEDARLALILNAIDPRCGGVLFAGKKGTGKTTLARLFPVLLREETPFVTLPLNITDEALLGTVDLDATLRSGERRFQGGILSRAHGGVLFIDDVNLLSGEILALLMEIHSRTANIVQREGFSSTQDACFVLLGTMNPEEGVLSPHFLDRFGMCVLWNELSERSDRILLLRRILGNRFQHNQCLHPADESLRNRVRICRKMVEQVLVPDTAIEHMAQVCEESGVSSHRAEVFLFYAARAYAAYCGDRRTKPTHVDSVAPLVLSHRRPHIMHPPETSTPDRETTSDDLPHPSDERLDQKGSAPDESTPQDANDDSSGEKRNKSTDHETSFPSQLKEEIFETGTPFQVRRFLFRRDRVRRLFSGRRTRTRSKDKGGRYVRSMMTGQNDVAVDATIRAAAPLQRQRNRQDTMIIRDRDLRYKQREKKTGHLVIFAVDGSGSMGAQRRMIESKAAVQSFLADSYLKRDKVAMVVFRKENAEIVLPPTSSMALATRALREIPTGGKTPLSFGLLESYSLIKRYAKKAPETRFLLVVITDGRANHSLTDMSAKEEAFRAALLLRELPSTDAIVVDTENKRSFTKADLAVSLAESLGADYYTVADLRAEYLMELVLQGRSDE